MYIYIYDILISSSVKVPWKVTDLQRSKLEEAYNLEAFPDLDRCRSLATQLGINFRQVYNWFKRRRRKERNGKENYSDSISLVNKVRDTEQQMKVSLHSRPLSD